MKVLHLPSAVGGNPQGLSKHLNQLGIQSETWVFKQNYIQYPVTKVLFSQNDFLISREMKRLKAFLYVFADYDVIHYNFGSTLYSWESMYPNDNSFLKKRFRSFYSAYLSFMQLFELNILKWRKILVFVHYQGTDARQGDYCIEHFGPEVGPQVSYQFYTPESDVRKRREIQRLSKYCKKIYALNPDLMYVLPPQTEFIPYSHISLNEWTPNYTQLQNRPLKIGHAPSNRKAKGTQFLLDALDNLKQEGYKFELILVEGMSHADAKAQYQDIDILVDQLLLGWYGGLAVEAMALGKPVIVYIREQDLGFVPPEMVNDFPFIQSSLETIEETLRLVLKMPREKLWAIAQQSRAYVEKWHDPLKIASKILKDYESFLS
ncbi:glycosyltransferase family 1 protein [Candidatus Synechococcus calcipolaris G9]|uniref:Glycosyltransferase family 1 protein n=1 Tax=Candidatus Synechococcus calcipolaris G9 TaxID=1497997 RepID=A0ABT6EW25_9SYNE|nr:glycosyltransferase family 1 protein [Candidatus Synechococcus calcipolaris]MDG2989986.1 glycosyltransferase family 1 protein [Candidatus Synechococcus calcipolaris G9]